MGAERLSIHSFSHSPNENSGTGSRPKAIITGARVGLGLETAKLLLSQGFDLVITGRSKARTREAADGLRSKLPDGPLSAQTVTGLALELGDLDSVKSFVAEHSVELSGWTHLVNNAGAKIESPYRSTAQGFEWHFGVNHLAHHLLTSLLLPIGAGSKRVVTVASIVARRGNPEHWGLTDAGISAGTYYSASKLANLAFMLQLQNRFSDVTATSAHPGFAKAEPYGNAFTRLGENLLAQSAAAGALPIAAAVLSEPGSYLGPRVLELWGPPAKAMVPETLRKESLHDLWDLSNGLTGATWPKSIN
jgi:NAD(P)-dependent dehydrogenase (short-subunit alcohol dehydrogenase family)